MAAVVQTADEPHAGGRWPPAPRAHFAAHPLAKALLAMSLAVASACGGSQAPLAPTRDAPPTPTTVTATPDPVPSAAPAEPTLATVPTPTAGSPAPPTPAPVTPAPATPVPPTPAPPAPPPQTVIVVAEGAAFVPPSLTAFAGEVTVTLDNRDAGVQHDLYLYSPSNAPAGSTAVIVGPAVASVTIDLGPGAYRFVCTVHPLQMRGVLTVQ